MIYVDGRADVRPLEILGVRTAPGDTRPALTVIRTRFTALAVAGSLVASDAGLRDDVAAIVDHGLTEVTLWGETLPAGMAPGLDRVQHRLSAAARAFKAQALAAAGVGDAAVGPMETFWSNATTDIAVMPDLMREI